MIKNLLSSLFVVAALAACGGGGGGGGGGAPTAAATVVSTLAFPLQQAIRNMNAYGNSATYESHGTLAAEATDGLCSGTLSSTNGAATASAMFEGTPVYSSTDSSTVTYTNCTPSSSTSGGTNYYDGNYDQVGYVDSSSYRTYGAWTAPATVHVGDNGTLVSEMVYTNSSKSVVQYRRDISFTVAADTASTAIVNIIVRYYFPDYVDSFGTHAVYTLFSTVQSRNRITVGASLVVNRPGFRGGPLG